LDSRPAHIRARTALSPDWARPGDLPFQHAPDRPTTNPGGSIQYSVLPSTTTLDSFSVLPSRFLFPASHHPPTRSFIQLAHFLAKVSTTTTTTTAKPFADANRSRPSKEIKARSHSQAATTAADVAAAATRMQPIPTTLRHNIIDLTAPSLFLSHSLALS
jgi:hypothetical protein